MPQRAFVSRQVPSKPGGVLPDDASYSSGRTVLVGVSGTDSSSATMAPRICSSPPLSEPPAEKCAVPVLPAGDTDVHTLPCSSVAGAAFTMVRGEVSAAPAMAAMAGVVGVVGCMPETIPTKSSV